MADSLARNGGRPNFATIAAVSPKAGTARIRPPSATPDMARGKSLARNGNKDADTVLKVLGDSLARAKKATKQVVSDSKSTSKPLGPRASRSALKAGSGAIVHSVTKKVPIVIIISVVAIGVLALVLYFLPSALRLRSIEVVGNSTLAAADVVGAALVGPGDQLLGIDTARVEAALIAWPPIEKAKVSRLFPDRLRIEIVERRPVVFSIAEIGGRSSLVAIDGSGVAFARFEPASMPDVPILSGIRFEDWKPGTMLPDFLLPTLESIEVVEKSDGRLLSLFSEIRVERSRFGELELLLFPLHHVLPVRTGASLNVTLLRSIILVLDAVSSKELAQGVYELDFRTGTIVFRTKEGHSG